MKAEWITIDRASQVAVADQISDQLHRYILEGKLRPGERLLPERDLADSLEISRGTVKRAYAKLLQSGSIEMRQGSGSYVMGGDLATAEYRAREAASLLSSTFDRLRGMGLDEGEILKLTRAQLPSQAQSNTVRRISLLAVSDNYNLLTRLERQITALTATLPFSCLLSFLPAEAVLANLEPVDMLLGYDIVITTTINYPSIVRLSPLLRHKTMEATLIPTRETLAQLAALPRDSRISVVYRSAIYREMVTEWLLSLDFHGVHIFCYHEMEYDPERHGENGVQAVITFDQSPVLMSPTFKVRNREFTGQGGVIICFDYQIDQESAVQIENQIRRFVPSP